MSLRGGGVEAVYRDIRRFVLAILSLRSLLITQRKFQVGSSVT